MVLQPLHADENDLQQRIEDALLRYEKVRGTMEYMDDSDMSGFDTKQAVQTVNALGTDISGVISEIEAIQKTKKDNDENYQAMLAQVKSVIIDINETKRVVSDAVMKMNVYNQQIAKSTKSLQETRRYILASKQTLGRLIELVYLVQNDFYGAGQDRIDDIKLLLKSDNISDTLSANDIVNTLVDQLNELVEELTARQIQYTEEYERATALRTAYKKLVLGYENKVQTLQEQKAYLMDFLKLYKSHKAALGKQMINLFETRAQLKAKITAVVRAVSDHKMSQAFLSSSGYQEFLDLKDVREQRKNFFLWPVLPITGIENYNSGLKIVAHQYQEVYAPANGIVYKAVDQDGIGINWLMLVHNDGYVTIFTSMNSVLVKEGDVVKRGQIIGLVGGQQGTRGAGFQSSGEALYMQIYQYGEMIEPLEQFDLSAVSNVNILPENYQVKYQVDLRQRDAAIRMSDVPFIDGKAQRDKTINFLKKYAAGPYAHIQLREAAAKDTSVDVDLGICIGLAETSLGRYFASQHNIGNVGNNDRGDRVDEDSPLAGARAIYLTLNNSYLGGYHTIYELSGFGNKDGAIYASSPYNRQKNVSRCLSAIK
ncbi:peptidoglycan DD-metalloendopeptidase family protein [Patescibacteria group bacterium]|nr:peptidoglycan DD-metalloendopeptidase family protein [Patescibacteria group bacterium]